MDDPQESLPPDFSVLEWDPSKNEFNIRKHGFDFVDANRVFTGPMLVVRDDREEYGEERWLGIGWLDARVVAIVFSEPDLQTIRVISLRKADRRERREFQEYIQNRLG